MSIAPAPRMVWRWPVRSAISTSASYQRSRTSMPLRPANPLPSRPVASVPRSLPTGESLERPPLGLNEHPAAGVVVELGESVEVAAPRAPKRLGAAVPPYGLAVLQPADSATVAGLSHVGYPLLLRGGHGPGPGLGR